MQEDKTPIQAQGGNAAEPTKVCRHCGKEKPISQFHGSNRSADGLQTYCKECKKELARQRTVMRRVKDASGLNPELADFQPRELIAELRARGFYGELKFINVIKV